MSATVKAFIQAERPNELVELQKLAEPLHPDGYQSRQTRVMDYVNRLDSYDGPDFAKLALSDPYRLYEEACIIYKTAAAKAMPWTPSSPTLSHTSAPRSSLRDGQSHRLAQVG